MRRTTGRWIWSAVALTVLLATASVAAQETSSEGAVFLTVQEAWARAERHHPAIVDAADRLDGLERDVVQREAVYAPGLTASLSGLTMRVFPDGGTAGPNAGLSLNASLKLRSGISLSASVSTRAGEDDRDDGRPVGGGEGLTGRLGLEYSFLRSAALDGDALALRQAEDALTVARREFEALQDEVRADVLAALHGEQTAAVRLAWAEEAYEQALAQQKTVTARVEAGIAPETDLIGARIDVLRAEQDVLNALGTWESRREQLLTMLGLEGGPDVYAFESVLHWTAMPEPPPMDEAVRRALEYSVTLWEHDRNVEMARLQWEAEKQRSGLDPRLSVSYNPSAASASRPTAVWRIDVNVSYPLLDGGQRERTLLSRQEAYERALEAQKDAARAIEEQVAEAYVQLADARRDVEIAELERLRARLELEQVQRQAELSVPVVGDDDVHQGKRALQRAEISWREAVQRYQDRWIGMQRLLGPVDWSQLVGTDGEESD